LALKASATKSEILMLPDVEILPICLVS